MRRRQRQSPRPGAHVLVSVCLVGVVHGQAAGYDPNQNMAADGTTVVRPQLPDDLPNPERWRYTPGGRIKPGDMFDRFLVSSFITPILFREEDIGFGGGVAVTDVDFRNRQWRELLNAVVSYSEEGQQQLSMHWRRWLNHRSIPAGGIIRDERSTVAVSAHYSRTLTRRFFGLGSRTPESAESSYTEEFGLVGVGTRFSVPEAGDDTMLSFGAEVQHHGLQRGRVEAVPSTDDVFRAQFVEADGVDQLWLSAGAAFDARDSLANPYEGFRIGASVAVAPLQTGLDAGALFSLDANGAVRLPPLLHDGGSAEQQNPPTDVLAVGGFVTAAAGELPYYSLPTLGGEDTLRGYIQRRFTDRVAVHGTVEYRFAIVPYGIRITDTIRIERIGAALFYDFGTLADDLDALGSGRFLDSYGAGFRIGFAREALFRVDLGFSEEDRLLTIAFGNTF